MSKGGAEREREREKQRERMPSSLHAVSTEIIVAMNLINCKIMTLAEIKSGRFNQLSHPGTPEKA